MSRRYARQSLLIAMVSILGILVGSCELDTSWRSDHEEAVEFLGNNEQYSCENLGYIVERDEADKSQIKITCDASDDGFCESSEIIISPSTAETNFSLDKYAISFNYQSCPNGFECKEDSDSNKYCKC